MTQVILDLETGQETVVELTPEELAAREAEEAVWLAPTPIDYAGLTNVLANVRTTDAVATEIFRFPCEAQRLCQAELKISGIDAANFTSKIMEGRFVWKRVTTTAVMVGIVVVSDIHDAAAAAWAPNAVASGSDIVFTVQGAAGRTIDWLLGGVVIFHAPGGKDV
jgi:hypothetical protein